MVFVNLCKVVGVWYVIVFLRLFAFVKSFAFAMVWKSNFYTVKIKKKKCKRALLKLLACSNVLTFVKSVPFAMFLGFC